MFRLVTPRYGRGTIAALLSLTLLGCVPPSATSGGAVAHPTKHVDEISSEEIDAERARFATAYELVRTLRPSMLLTRGPTSPTKSSGLPMPARRGIKVYLDGVDFGGVESLTTIPAESVLTVRTLSGLDATTRFGTGNAEGAIMITTRGDRLRR